MNRIRIGVRDIVGFLFVLAFLGIWLNMPLGVTALGGLICVVSPVVLIGQYRSHELSHRRDKLSLIQKIVCMETFGAVLLVFAVYAHVVLSPHASRSARSAAGMAVWISIGVALIVGIWPRIHRPE